MIGQAILFPTLFSNIPANEPGRTLTFSGIVSLLQDLSESCVILIDEKELITQEIRKGLDGWPADFRKQASSLLEFIAKKNRVVRLKLLKVKSGGCCPGCQQACDLSLNILNEKRNAISFVPDFCTSCISQVDPKLSACTIERYPLSHFFRQRRSFRTITLRDGEWTAIQLADELIQPLSQHASILKIYDRLLVASMWSSPERSVPASQLKLFIPQHFVRTLDWLFGILAASKPQLPVEIYSALNTGTMDSPTLALAKQAIVDFQEDVKKRFQVNVRVFPKREASFQKMPHGRYLMTNQFAFLIERGFDLLWDDQQMQKGGFDPKTAPRRVRDVSISLCQDASSVEIMTAKLRPAF